MTSKQDRLFADIRARVEAASSIHRNVDTGSYEADMRTLLEAIDVMQEQLESLEIRAVSSNDWIRKEIGRTLDQVCKLSEGEK